MDSAGSTRLVVEGLGTPKPGMHVLLPNRSTYLVLRALIPPRRSGFVTCCFVCSELQPGHYAQIPEAGGAVVDVGLKFQCSRSLEFHARLKVLGALLGPQQNLQMYARSAVRIVCVCSVRARLCLNGHASAAFGEPHPPP